MNNEKLSHLIGRIYDCALDPGRWPAALGDIARAVDASVGMVAVHDLIENRPIRTFAHGMPAAALWLYELRYATTNPIALALANERTEGKVETVGTLVGTEGWVRSAIYREFLRPLQLGDVLGVAALRGERRGVWMGTLRRRTQPGFGAAEIQLFHLLAPHVVRAMRFSDILELRVVESQRLTTVLDGLSTAIWLVDQQGLVLQANAAADALLRRNTVLRVVRDRLTATGTANASLLDASIRRATAGDFAGDTTEAAVPLGHGAAGAGLIVTVMPLRVDGSAPAAVVFVQDPMAAPTLPLSAFSALHRLTKAEARCLNEIALGRNLPEVAMALGIAPTTARTHLNNIFQKTGSSSQAELLRLVASFAPPLRD